MCVNNKMNFHGCCWWCRFSKRIGRHCISGNSLIVCARIQWLSWRSAINSRSGHLCFKRSPWKILLNIFTLDDTSCRQAKWWWGRNSIWTIHTYYFLLCKYIQICLLKSNWAFNKWQTFITSLHCIFKLNDLSCLKCWFRSWSSYLL